MYRYRKRKTVIGKFLVIHRTIFKKEDFRLDSKYCGGKGVFNSSTALQKQKYHELSEKHVLKVINSE